MVASIAGISIEELNYMETVDGVAYNGRILLDGQVIGFFNNDGRGGETTIFVEAPFRRALRERVESFTATHSDYKNIENLNDFLEV